MINVVVLKFGRPVNFLNKVIVEGIVITLVVVICFYLNNVFMVGVAKKLPFQAFMVTGA